MLTNAPQSSRKSKAIIIKRSIDVTTEKVEKQDGRELEGTDYKKLYAR